MRLLLTLLWMGFPGGLFLTATVALLGWCPHGHVSAAKLAALFTVTSFVVGYLRAMSEERGYRDGNSHGKTVVRSQVERGEVRR